MQGSTFLVSRPGLTSLLDLAPLLEKSPSEVASSVQIHKDVEQTKADVDKGGPERSSDSVSHQRRPDVLGTYKPS